MRRALAFLAIACLTYGLRLPKFYDDNMVLQAERPVVFGWTNASSITVSVDGSHECKAIVDKAGRFDAQCEPQQPSDPNGSGSTIIIAEGDGGATATLNNVLFGSVYILSGQSNAEFAIPMAFNGQDFIARANDPGMRLLTVQLNGSSTPLEDVIELAQPWSPASTETLCGGPTWDKNRSDYCLPHCGGAAVVPSYHRVTWGYFSALGYLAGRAVRVARPNRAVGVIATSWGGTAIQLWEPANVSAACGSRATMQRTRHGVQAGSSLGPGDLWNSMVHPLLPMPVEGYLWMQGEANSGSEDSALQYACELPGMINTWRQQWRPRFPGFPEASVFGVVQLAPWTGPSSIPQLRWSQFASTARMANVTVASAIDLFDSGSPCGNVHFRDKQPAAERIAATWRAWLHGDSTVPDRDPEPVSASLDASTQRTVEVHIAPHSAQGISVVAKPNQTTSSDWTNFELLVTDSTASQWVCANATLVERGSDAVDAVLRVEPRTALAAGTSLAGVRYAWAAVPNGKLLLGASFEGANPDGSARTFHRAALPFVLLPPHASSMTWLPMNATTPIPGGNEAASRC